MLKRFKFNIIYLLLPIALYLIFQIGWQSKQETITFNGFAENKETELNFDKSVLIKNIFVTPNESVQLGDTLLSMVIHSENDVKLSDVEYDIQKLKIESNISKKELEANIRTLEAEKAVKLSEIESEIRTLQSEINLNQSILSELKSVDVNGVATNNSPNAMKIQALQKEMEMVARPIDAEIKKIRLEISQTGEPSKVEINKLRGEADIRKKEEQSIFLIAPSDGLVGNVHCKVGENISSFNTLISFYERNPSLVKSYVHENLILTVQVGDSLEVISSYHPDNKVVGKVVGMGSRIVEIPERLRKLPEIKTYGREVIVALPPVNSFLQKEKVVLNLLGETLNDHTNSTFKPQIAPKKDPEISIK